MPKKIKGRNGGTLINSLPGETMNPNGRPKVPKKLKEFIKGLETENDEIMFPSEAIELVEKDGKKFYKLKGSKGGKMFLTAYNKALKGDVRWAEFLVKMGFAGGFEPTKTDHTTKGESLNQKTDLSKLSSQELEKLEKIQKKLN